MVATMWRCDVPLVAMRSAPGLDAERVSELLFGEVVRIEQRSFGWVGIQTQHDGYRGWIPETSLQTGAGQATHRAGLMSALVFTRPDIKSSLVQRLHRGSSLRLHDTGGDFLELADGGFIHRRHVVPVGLVASDPVAVALSFLGTPYLWGGRTGDGIDCSALVQTALLECGIACPRDTGDQCVAFGAHRVAGKHLRGDLIYFPGHVGIMVDSVNMLHANAFWMMTMIEPLEAVVDRLRPSAAEPILAVIRLDCRVRPAA